MRYEPGRRGHAPGHLREMFCEAVEFGSIDLEQHDVPVEVQDNPALWIVGQLWNSTDVMPRDTCEMLDLPQGSSFASGARAFREAPDLENLRWTSSTIPADPKLGRAPLWTST